MVRIVVPKEYEEQARELLAAGELQQLEIREDDDDLKGSGGMSATHGFVVGDGPGPALPRVGSGGE